MTLRRWIPMGVASRWLRILSIVAGAVVIASELSTSQAGTLYWDTDGSTAGNNTSTGANLGGSGNWSAADASWWNTNVGTLQVWTDGSDAVFWGTAGAATASTVSPNSLAFKTTGYSVNAGT